MLICTDFSDNELIADPRPSSVFIHFNIFFLSQYYLSKSRIHFTGWIAILGFHKLRNIIA
jgi:hypothetical protein